MDAKWTVCGKRADFKGIGEKFGIDQVIARVIRNRDVIGDAAIDMYLNGTLDMVHDPRLMADMERGCQIMAEKIREGKSIRIISDYDVDGVMSNYILLDGLRRLGAKVTYEIPDRVTDGYGINERMIEDAYRDGVDTIITCDNGIAAFPAISLAKKYGMTIIVTDHHDIPYEIDGGNNRQYKLVDADAVIDIKREDCSYPYKGLCGAGVAYKFIRCLYDTVGASWEDPERYIEMLAIATQCDVMELTDENRIYVREGLKLLQRTKNIGLKCLIDQNGLAGKQIYSYHLGFVLGPCINAAGRLESAREGLELLLCGDEAEAMKMAASLMELNTKRKGMTNDGVLDAVREVEDGLRDDTVLVIYLPKLHESLAGIVAGRIREQYYKPVFVMTDSEEGMLKGSGRSIEGYHMFDALSEIKDILEKFGGHALAAGLSIRADRLSDMRRLLNENQRLTEEQLTPVVKIDVPMPISYLSIPLVEQLKLLEPFGKGNEKPLFAQARLGIKSARVFGADGRYIRICFQDEDGATMEAVDFDGIQFQECIKVWFNDEECGKILKGLPNQIKLDVAYYPDINEYGGRRTVQIKPVMYRKSAD
ncbi:MAG: single-stranded-DNA-specific exonuclease RecJ [Clostridium sp.]|nr:single-stranded-DNA-specific exonuclease RecJ [Clostridium sp.]MCM1399111.1 single-stranded-DNA-specific exonuclease RecJ [Clostridium sp.]MCM1459503.1 single-stranded-DNA-specific exonuclease RecJ [Bacteroides sp.]